MLSGLEYGIELAGGNVVRIASGKDRALKLSAWASRISDYHDYPVRQREVYVGEWTEVSQ